MTNLPIAALMARDAVEQQFRGRNAVGQQLRGNDAVEQQFRGKDAVRQQSGGKDAVEQQFREITPEQQARGRARLAGARALRRLADRLEPRSLSPEPAQRARPAGHRGSPC
jgi:hypothetical protein